MLIGIKYCGGCNPFYDRKAEVEKLKESVEGVCFEPVQCDKNYDKILLVCGCGRACIRRYIISGENAISEAETKYYILKSREDFSEVQKLLK